MDPVWIVLPLDSLLLDPEKKDVVGSCMPLPVVVAGRAKTLVHENVGTAAVVPESKAALNQPVPQRSSVVTEQHSTP